MVSAAKDLAALRQRQLDVCLGLESALAQVIDHRHGSAWGSEQVEQIEAYFSRLRQLDAAISRARRGLGQGDAASAERRQVSELRQAMLRLKQRLSVLQARIEGGHRHVREELRQVVKNANIKGYKQVNGRTAGSVTCTGVKF